MISFSNLQKLYYVDTLSRLAKNVYSGGPPENHDIQPDFVYSIVALSWGSSLATPGKSNVSSKLLIANRGEVRA